MPAGSTELLTLAIETSNPSSSPDPDRGAGVCVGLVTRHRGASEAGHNPAVRAVAVEFLATSGRGANEDTLFPAIDRALRGAGARPHDLRLIAASVGPGGYTGVRVACAAAKMLSEAASSVQRARGEPEDRLCLCVAVPTHIGAILQRTRDEPSCGGALIRVALASKKESAWISPALRADDLRSERAGQLARQPGGVHTANDLPWAGEPATLLHDRFLPDSIRERLDRAGWSLSPLVLTPESVLEAASFLEPIDPAFLNPIYPREPDAVTLWRQRHGPGAAPAP